MTKITLYVEGADAFATEGQAATRYGVTLAVGADRVPQQHGSYSPFAALMKPWKWQWPVPGQTRNPADQRLNFPKATGLSGYASQKRNICATESGLREMENYANACFVNFVENSGGVIGQTGGQRYALDMPRDALDAEVPFEDTSNTIAWPQLLANLAQVPGAVGRRLNLLTGFSTDANVTVERTHLLPSFLVEWGPPDARKQAVLEPGDSSSQVGSSEEGYTIFSYGFSGPDGDELGAEFDVEAFVSLRKTPAANNPSGAPGPYVDQTSGWIRLPKEQVDLSTRDWFAEFPIDVQKSLDLPNHFINTLKKKLDDNKSKPGDDGSTGSEFEFTSELQAKIEEVFIRLVGPSLALGVPPVELLIQSDNRWLLADWIRKSLLFDVTRSPKLSIEDDNEPLMQLFFADSNDSDTVKEVKKKIVEALLAAASSHDKLFTPEIVVEVGQPVPNGSYRDLADALFEAATENGLERRFQFLRNRFGTPDSAPSEGENLEAVDPNGTEEEVQPATANNLSEVLSAIRSENMARPVLYKLYGKALENVAVPDDQDEFVDLRRQLVTLDNRLGLWANDSGMPGTGGNSDILGRALRDRLRYLIEEPLPSKQQTSIWTLLKAFINFFAADSAEEKLIKDVLGRQTPDLTASDLDAIERVKRATTLVGWVAICRAVAPVLDVDESGEMTPEGSVISDIARAMASELEARVASLVGVQATDTVDANTPIVLEPKTRSERPEPVVLTIGQIGNSQTSENFTGFGVLARRNETSRNGASAGDWHCLTLGAPHLIKFAAREVSATNSLIGLGHAPVRIIEQYELSSWIMVNDGKSLSAVPLSVNPENAPSFVPEPDGSNDSDDFGIEQDRIVVVQPDKTAFSDALCGDDPTSGDACLACLNDERLFKFPALKYGETLEYLFFVQKNNSFLPWEIAEADDPGLFRLPGNGSMPARVPPPASNDFKSTVRVRHLRRTPVSAPRLVGLFNKEPKLNERADSMVNNRAFNRRFNPFVTPKINREAVQPLTDLLYGNPSRDPLEQTAPTPGTGSEESRKRNDLVLLTPPNKSDEAVWLDKKACHSFIFNVLPPTVGIEDYQRWRFRDMRAPTDNLKSDPERTALQYEEDVVATLTAYGAALEYMERVAAPGDGNEETKERAEIAPDDPAVTAIGLRLKQIDISENGTTFSVVDLDKTAIVELMDNPDHLANMPTVSGPDETLEVERALKVLQGPIRVEIETLAETDTNNTRALRDRIDFKLLEKDARPGKDKAESAHALKIKLPGGHMFQLEIISLVHKKFYTAPEDPASTARFRFAPDHAEGNDAEVQTSADRKFAEFVEVATTTLDLEIATERMPSTEDVFNSIDLIGEDDGNLLVGFVPPEDNAVSDFRFVSDATLSRQRWRWTGRSSGAGSPKNGNGNAEADADKLDLRRLSKRVWEETAGLLENAGNGAPVRGMRRNGRAVLEPQYTVITNDPDNPELFSLNGDGSAGAVKSWQDLIETDGEWFAAIPDTDRFDETDGWPTLVPPASAFGDETATALRTRGLVLARIPLADRPQAQYWRFAALLRSRYGGLMRADHRDRISSCPWRRVILRPDYADRTGQEPPAPRLRLIIPLPGPIEPKPDNAFAEGSSSGSLGDQTSKAWSSFLAVFDETWGEVAGLAEYIDAWVAPTTASDEDVGAQTNELTAIFTPVHDIPEFGFDPILRGDNPLRDIDFEPGTDRYPYVHTDGSPIGLTFENAVGARPVRTMVEVRLKTDEKDLEFVRGGEGDRIFAEISFRRRIEYWTTGQEDGKQIRALESDRTRLEWALFGASNAVWRFSTRQKPGLPHWVDHKDLRFDLRSRTFRIPNLTGAGDQEAVALHATNATEPIRDAAPRTSLVRRLFVVLTYETRGASGIRQSEVFLGVGMIPELQFDRGLNAERLIFPDRTAAGSADLERKTVAIAGFDDTTKPIFWWDGDPLKQDKVFARLVEVEFHKEHKTYKGRGFASGAETDDGGFMRESIFLGEDNKEFFLGDHPLFDALLGVYEEGGPGGRRDAEARVSRVSPRIDMLEEDT